MSDRRSRLVALVAAAVVVATNAYWYRRVRAVSDGLRTSLAWDERNEFDAGGADERLERLAETLGTSVEDVPDAVEALDEKVRDLQTSQRAARERWATATVEALGTPAPGSAGRPLIVHLRRGTSDDAQAVATALDEAGLALVCAHEDTTFVLTSGEESDQSAVDLARAATADAAGGAGGSPTFAQGGGPDESVFDRLASTLRTRVGDEVTTITLGETGESR